MSTGEIVGLVLAAAFGGMGIGLGMAAVLLPKRAERDTREVQALDAFARWLTARKVLTRASMSFVTNFRKLTDTTSRLSDARRSEAVHARDAWRRAMSELDASESVLIAWSENPLIQDEVSRHPRVAPDAIRSAIDGDEPGVERLAQELATVDRVAAQAVRTAITGTGARRMDSTGSIRILKRLLARVEAVTNRMARR